MDSVCENIEITNQKIFINFMNWAKKNGAIFPDISFKIYGKNERGLHSQKNIRRGTNLIKIPLNMIIHDGMGETTSIGHKLIKYKSRINNFSIIMVTVFILTTIKTNHFFKPYYDILPRDISNFPIFWNNVEYDLLTGSHILYMIRHRQKSFIEDYRTIIEICPEFKQWTLKDFLWARTIVGSRNFGINISGISRTALVPLSDMLNHDQNPMVKWSFDNKDDYFKMKSNEHLKKNIAITDTYGNKCNSQYFLYYGFALPNNFKNTIRVNLIHPHSNDKQNKDEIVQNVKGLLGKDIDKLIFNELMVFLRISLSDKKMIKKYKYRSQYFYPINNAHEIIVLKAFDVYLNTLLSKYKLSYDKINEQLSDTPRLSKKWNGLILLKGENEVIFFYKKLIQQSLDYITKKNDSFDEKYNSYFIKLRKLRNDCVD
ncbi:SET domain-containing protein [Crocinitomicaceae bacterium]|nr:SET domain-containing protein [Crocinitomicaceae bacterium]